jgi:phosphoglycolate phosphatase
VSPRYRPVLFDLDGTVADTYPGILAAVAQTLAALQLPPVAPEHVYPLTGRGVPALVRGVLGASDDALYVRALELYRARYAELCTVGARAYPGIPELLSRLGGPLALLTNKPRLYTERILESLGLAGTFAALIAGDDPGSRLKPDPWPIAEALRKLAVPSARPVLVGDTRSDFGAARAAGIACVLVGWGHGGGGLEALGCPVAREVSALESLLVA